MEVQENNDNVNHPSHYTNMPFGLEVIEITQHYNFCMGCALKYILRSGLKHENGMDDSEKGIEDLRKAIWYIQREIENRRKNNG